MNDIKKLRFWLRWASYALWSVYPSQWAFKLNLSEEPRTLHLEDLTFLTFLMFQKLGFYHLPPESQIEFDHSSLIILTLRGIWHRGEGDHAKLYCYFARQQCRGVSMFAKSVVLKLSGALFVFPSFLESSHVQWSIWLLFQTFKWQKYAKILKTLVSFPD